MTHKFVALDNRKQELFGIEVARLRMQDREVPIVVTTEEDRLTLFWWHMESSSWRSWERRHTRVSVNNFRMANIRELDWSLTIGLTASNDRVWLVYKRVPLVGASPAGPHLYMDVFDWDSNNNVLLTPTDLGRGPIHLPLGHEQIGSYVWTGYDSTSLKLVLVFQSIETESTIWVVPGHFDDGVFDPNKLPSLPPFEFDAPDRNWDEFFPPIPEPDPIGPDDGPGPRPLLFSDRPSPPTPRDPPRPPEGPIIPPRDPEMGYYMDYIPPKAFSATTTTINLVAHSIDADNDRLDDEDQWSPPLLIDEGGYDFDILLRNGLVHCVYRRSPYTLSFENFSSSADKVTISPTVNIGIPTFHPLFYRVIEAGSLQIDQQKSLDDIPGGDHPQIQLLDPTLVITVDRLSDGDIFVSSALSGVPTDVRLYLSSSADLRTCDKYWIQLFIENQQPIWHEVHLSTYDAKFWPRSLSSNRCRLPAYVTEVSRSEVHFSLLLRTRQMFLWCDPDLDSNREKWVKDWELTFLRKAYGSASPDSMGFLGRFLYTVRAGETYAHLTSFSVIDLTHTQVCHIDGLDPWSEDLLPRGRENVQFTPLNWTPTDDEYPLANTLGGCLV
ncbi:MAG: hypothetical protein ACW99Q_22410, partial [Candidatus Kariarchaeaceae archaeon]